MGNHELGKRQGVSGVGRAAGTLVDRRVGGSVRGGGFDDVYAGYLFARASVDQASIRRSRLRSVRIRGCVSSDERVGLSRCIGDRHWGHAAGGGEFSVGKCLEVVHGESGGAAGVCVG